MEESRPMRAPFPARLLAGISPVRPLPGLGIVRSRVTRMVAVSVLALPLAAGSSLLGCGDEGEPYKPIVPPAGAKASLPPVPTVPKLPIKEGEAYTVWGASYYLRSRVHHDDVAGRDLKVTGYIIA